MPAGQNPLRRTRSSLEPFQCVLSPAPHADRSVCVRERIRPTPPRGAMKTFIGAGRFGCGGALAIAAAQGGGWTKTETMTKADTSSLWIAPARTTHPEIPVGSSGTVEGFGRSIRFLSRNVPSTRLQKEAFRLHATPLFLLLTFYSFVASVSRFCSSLRWYAAISVQAQQGLVAVRIRQWNGS